MNINWLIKLSICVFEILLIIITVYLIPFIKSKIGSDKYDLLISYISCAVRCAEQIYDNDENDKKKQYVMDFVMDIINNKLHIDMEYDTLNTLVEGIVNEIKHCTSDGALMQEVSMLEGVKDGDTGTD
jgi:hypothetical protein